MLFVIHTTCCFPIPHKITIILTTDGYILDTVEEKRLIHYEKYQILENYHELESFVAKAQHNLMAIREIIKTI